jgi:hypothetical protein
LSITPPAAPGQRAPDLVGGRAARPHRDARGVQLAVDRHLDGAAELVAAARAAQHLAEIDAGGVALEIEGERGLAGIDHAREAERAAVERALEVRDGEHAILQRGGEVGIADAQG